jgi:REP element-mobilizing transposase RayT
MPDHLHVLLRGREASSDLLGFVQRFKQVTGFHFKTISGDQPWQQSFFDRVLRAGEDPGDIARYVFDNPVEAGLPAGHAAYFLRGGAFFRGAAPDGAKASSLHLDS